MKYFVQYLTLIKTKNTILVIGRTKMKSTSSSTSKILLQKHDQYTKSCHSSLQKVFGDGVRGQKCGGGVSGALAFRCSVVRMHFHVRESGGPRKHSS